MAGSRRMKMLAVRIIPALTLGIAGALAAPAPSQAARRGLIVGIDAYKEIRRLKGAVNDADDLSGVLRSQGFDDLVVLEDARATRAALTDALGGLVERARPGDWIFISFAGHGTSERWGSSHPADAREGEPYESFLLAGFAPPSQDITTAADRAAFGERILGREMRAWLKRLDDKGARVIFVADSCYAGGMTRKVVPGTAPPSYRQIPPFPTPPDRADPLLPALIELPPDADSQFDHLRLMPNVTFLAAVDRQNLAPEFEIPAGSGTRRGALSYSVARALAGEADADRDGRITRQELYLFVSASVRQISQHRQLPELQPTFGEDSGKAVVASLKDEPIPSPPMSQHDGAGVSRTVRVFVDGSGTVPFSAGSPGPAVMERAASRDTADYIWIPATGKVVSQVGDVVAEGVDAASMRGVAEREIARRELVELSRTHPVDFRLSGPNADHLHRQGERVSFEVETASGTDQHYLVFNIAGDGTVQFLYPIKRDLRTLPGGRTPFEASEIQAPYGSDLLVLVTSPASLDPLIDAIRAMSGRRTPLDAVAAIEAFGTDALRMATQGLFSQSGN
ncbi:caspase family protein [Aureimonas leprariae]|uniref:EF-hand domain-containing protein n=1 Tax=Plantimonas leprariae TaxID=2615207 RepID=A0A7V7U129_9HYPH|nr:caspase family protein [Aureimonas leprariae]KAB0681347.1 hypothetical protein F6X38_05530 [Aureimonas leprariae]